MAGVAAFLASDDASYITGEDILIDAGMRALGRYVAEREVLQDQIQQGGIDSARPKRRE